MEEWSAQFIDTETIPDDSTHHMRWTSPSHSANDTLRSQEQSPSRPYINTQGLQRRLSNYYFWGGSHREAAISRGKARKVLAILQKATADKECKSQLLRLLTRNCLDLIRVLIRSRHGATSSDRPPNLRG